MRSKIAAVVLLLAATVGTGVVIYSGPSGGNDVNPEITRLSTISSGCEEELDVEMQSSLIDGNTVEAVDVIWINSSNATLSGQLVRDSSTSSKYQSYSVHVNTTVDEQETHCSGGYGIIYKVVATVDHGSQGTAVQFYENGQKSGIVSTEMDSI